MSLDQRRAGVLLHPTSFPVGDENGVLGSDAYRFIDFLAQSGLSVWQMLPLGPTHGDKSPYQSLSAHAGNPDLICWQSILRQDWLAGYDRQAALFSASQSRQQGLEWLCQTFSRLAPAELQEKFTRFKQKNAYWLPDYSLFMAIKLQQGNGSWVDWPVPLRNRNREALDTFAKAQAHVIDSLQLEQFFFFEQWLAIKRYANDNGIFLFGDLPLFVSHDSADVWAKREYFKLDAEGHPLFVAGVPPDYFSETGQLWGNPVYDWQSIASDGYQFWLERLSTQLTLFDQVRIDHFRGLEAYWEIPADHETALNGYWVKGPGEDFFQHLIQYFGDKLPLVAEDLGFITEEVLELREKFNLPGMKILQFAFDSDARNPYLPHNHEVLSVVYTGTHDNNTTCGWFAGLSEDLQHRVYEYYGHPQDVMPWLLVRSAFMSPAMLAVIPLQDFLALGSDHRMNTPGTAEGNWQWRFRWDMKDFGSLADRIKKLVNLYGRAGA